MSIPHWTIYDHKRSAVQYRRQPLPEFLAETGYKLMPPALPRGCWVAGGWILRQFRQEPAADADLFFADAAATAAARSKDLGLGQAMPSFIDDVFFPSAEDVIDRFDITVIQFALDGQEIVYNPQGLQDLRDSRLRVHKTIRDLGMFRSHRILKYRARGFITDLETLEAVSPEYREPWLQNDIDRAKGLIP